MTDSKAARIHLGTGVFWFWPQPWWTAIDPATLQRQGVSGVQVLCEPVLGSPALPPADLVRSWRADLEVTVHPTFYDHGSLTFSDALEQAFDRLGSWLLEAGVTTVVIHTNHLRAGRSDIDAVRRRLPPIDLLVENVGARAASGHTLSEAQQLLESDPTLGFVLDVAHLSEVQVEGQPAKWLSDSLIRERLRMVHVSQSGIARPDLRRRCPEDLQSADHLPTFVGAFPDDDALLTSLAGKPLVIEGCLPAGPEGSRWLNREIEYLSSFLCRESQA